VITRHTALYAVTLRASSSSSSHHSSSASSLSSLRYHTLLTALAQPTATVLLLSSFTLPSCYIHCHHLFTCCLCIVEYNSQPWWLPGRQRSVYPTTSPTERPSELIAHYQSVYVCLFIACMHICTPHSQDQSRGRQGENGEIYYNYNFTWRVVVDVRLPRASLWAEAL